jgi:hypothetical protein
MEELASQVYKRSKESEAQNLAHRFVTAGDTAFIAISKELVRKLNINENTWAYEYEIENGIHIVFSKNSTQEADEQDYGE